MGSKKRNKGKSMTEKEIIHLIEGRPGFAETQQILPRSEAKTAGYKGIF